MLRRVALVRTDVSEEFSAYIIKVKIDELGTTFAATSNRSYQRRNTVTYYDGGDKFLRNVDSYKRYTSSHLRRPFFVYLVFF
jgi:hypothetical protein